MLDVIQLLPDAIANQIAAGEVVQRPASVVKELLENAVDAQATDVQLIIKDSGKALIQVVDNGQGMTETDVPALINTCEEIYKQEMSKHLGISVDEVFEAD